MTCSKCKQTDTILTGENSNIVEYKGRKAKTFSDLRFDFQNNQLDINMGLIDAETGEVIEGTSQWSDGLDINFCPCCGEKLEEVQ